MNGNMNETVLNFLGKESICVISVSLQDGTIHSATVHYSHTAEPLKIYIQTSNETLKAKPFLKGEIGTGALVVGFSRQDWLTLQMHGEVRAILDPKELEPIYKVHYGKNPGAEKQKGPDTIMLEFSPTWWRYTDFNTRPKTVISSED